MATVVVQALQTLGSTPTNHTFKLKGSIRSSCQVFHALTLPESIALWKVKGCFTTATKNERSSPKSGLELLFPYVGMLPGQPVPGNQTDVWSPQILTPKSSPLKHSFTSRHSLLILIPVVAWCFTSLRWVFSPTGNSCSAPSLLLLPSLQVAFVSLSLTLPLHVWAVLGGSTDWM